MSNLEIIGAISAILLSCAIAVIYYGAIIIVAYILTNFIGTFINISGLGWWAFMVVISLSIILVLNKLGRKEK